MRILLILLFSWILQAGAQPLITSHNLPAGYTTNQLRWRSQLKIDPTGNKWVAFPIIGLAKYDGLTWMVYDSLNSGLPSNNIRSLDFDASGNMWVGTSMGAVFYDGIVWQLFNSQNTGVPLDLINSVTVHGTNVWFGTNTGAVKFDGTTWTNYNTSNSGIPSDTVKKIIADPNGNMWLATKQGVCYFGGTTWLNFNSSNSILPVNDIFDILADGYGRIWVSPNVNNQVFYIEGDTIVRNFHGAIYNEQLLLNTGKTTFGKDDVNNIYLISSSLNQAIVRVFGNNYDFYYLAPNILSLGSSISYSMAFDSVGSLWYLPHFSSPNSDALKEISFWGYLPQPLLTPTIHNSKSLNINDVHALIMNRGDMHWDPSDISDGRAYEVPKGSGNHASYASALWIGGLDAGGNLHVAAQSYRQSGTDYWPGPISGISQPFDSSTCVQFDKIYEVYKWQVEEFKTNFLNGSVSNGTYPVPVALAEWPAKGNGIITDDKAPFVDYNSDNSYNPMDGDYPLIKGDQMLFWMFNDSLAEHNNTDPGSLGVEVHGSAYAYSCPGIADSNQVLNRTTLYQYRIINRSANDYHNLYLGLWNSSVIGSYMDNFMGCDTLLASGFAYNGDNNDEVQFGGYGLNPPMQNVVVLRGMEADTGDGIDNDLDGITDETGERTTMNHFISADGPPSTPMSNPFNDLHHYQYMQSIWLDGQHLTYGDDGRDITAPLTNFKFPGTPYTSQWNESSVGNPPTERKYVLGSGPVSLPSGGEITIDFAYVFTWDSLSPNGLTTSIARNSLDVQRVQNWFDTDNFPSCLIYSVGTEDVFDENQHLKIYPNPAKEVVYLDVKGGVKNDRVEVMDMTGRLVLSRRYHSYSGIDISFLQEGVYTVRVVRKKSVLTGKFLKSH